MGSEIRSPVDDFLSAVEAGDIEPCAAWSHDAVLDATVPGWRFRRRGPAAIKEEYSHWFADEGHFAELRRQQVEGGEVVDYLLTWIEDGVPHAARHMHTLDVRDGLITRDSVVCGGRWPQPLLEEMQAAQDAEDSRAGA